jgi:hypothetical protein
VIVSNASQNIMNIKLIRSYKSKNGNTVFVYAVSGSTAQLADYKAKSGEFYREDDKGNALWFTTRCVGTTGKLIITSNGKIVPDMSEFDQAASIAAQYGGNFGQALAQLAASKLVGGGNVQVAPVVAPEEKGAIDNL